MRLSKTDSVNRHSLVEYDVDIKNEPNNHKEYKEKWLKPKEYNAQQESQDGWIEIKSTKTKVYLKKYESEHTAYENQIWRLFFNMGFRYLNKSGKNSFYYGLREETKLSFSVFGQDKDEYSFIFLDCFTTENQDQLDAKLNTMKEEFGMITKYLAKKLEDNELIFKYIVAIKGFELSPEQERIMNDNNFTVITDIDVKYFEDLYTNLKSAAYYQFCGKLFEGMTIPKIETKIPAIRGRMGGHRYYAFSIDPQILLRLSFVLHKTKAHEEAMPTYQRLVKKSRLTSITDFLNDHGFFPNSIVVNLNEECEFEEAQADRGDCNIDTEIGYLKIPQRYRVAYIIDGQHRLMGYAGCVWPNQQIPVVAFEKLSKPTQVKLFMEINEKQKQVPKELRLTLEKDPYSAKDNKPSLRFEGLKREIAFSFADNNNSPLYGYVGNGIDVGEFTLDFFVKAMTYSARTYFGRIKVRTEKETKKRIEELDNPGIFFRGDLMNDECYEQARVAVRDFLFKCVGALISALKDNETLENVGKRNVFLRNPGMQGYLKFIADVVDYKKEEILQTIDTNALAADPIKVYDIISPYLQPVSSFVQNCAPDEGRRLKTLRGDGAPTPYQRSFQRELHNRFNDFTKEGLDDWITGHADEIIESSLNIIVQLKKSIINEFKNRFSGKEVTDWVLDSLPDDVKKKCNESKRNDNNGEGKTLWDYVKYADLFSIACYDSNDPLIRDDFSNPSIRRNANVERRYDWIKKILKIEKDCIENHFCKTDDKLLLEQIHNHFRNKGLI